MVLSDMEQSEESLPLYTQELSNFWSREMTDDLQTSTRAHLTCLLKP